MKSKLAWLVLVAACGDKASNRDLPYFIPRPDGASTAGDSRASEEPAGDGRTAGDLGQQSGDHGPGRGDAAECFETATRNCGIDTGDCRAGVETCRSGRWSS